MLAASLTCTATSIDGIIPCEDLKFNGGPFELRCVSFLTYEYSFKNVGPVELEFFLGTFTSTYGFTNFTSELDATRLVSSPGTPTDTNTLSRTEMVFLCNEDEVVCFDVTVLGEARNLPFPELDVCCAHQDSEVCIIPPDPGPPPVAPTTAPPSTAPSTTAPPTMPPTVAPTSAPPTPPCFKCNLYPFDNCVNSLGDNCVVPGTESVFSGQRRLSTLADLVEDAGFYEDWEEATKRNFHELMIAEITKLL